MKHQSEIEGINSLQVRGESAIVEIIGKTAPFSISGRFSSQNQTHPYSASISTIHNLHPLPLRHDTMPDFQDQYTEAIELVELGRLEEALTLFQTLLKIDSNKASIWNNIGIIRFRRCEYRDAVNAFGQATDIDPKFTNAWFKKSLALVNLGKDNEALRALEKVLKLNPHDKEAQSQRELIVRKMAHVSDKRKMDSHSMQVQLRVSS